jgi:aspartyl-tRNA(Asn)/glutamyl-tRNA(Gln) amidotransferase subunit A
MKLYQLTISRAKEGLKKKEFSVKELLISCLEQIKTLNPKLNAFITVCEKEALKEAEKRDLVLKNFRNLGEVFEKFPLWGIPIAAKDLFCTKGVRTTAASKVLENYVPVYDATVIRKLKEAGAIIIGKTNCDAWAHGSSGENSDFGPTKNPFDDTRVPGGSSSGSAVAVATGMSLAATGTDTGGSIRLPAAFCGVVGLKPTYGRVSRFGVIAMASSLDSIGHFTKNVEDAALILKVIAGKDPYDATTPPIKVPDYLKSFKKDLKGIKIGFPKEYFIKGTTREIEKQLLLAIKKLEKLGAKIVDISLPYTKYAIAVYYIIQSAEVSSNLARYDGIRYGGGREKFGNEAKRRIMLGTYVLSAGYYDAYYLKAMKVRTLIIRDFEEAFRQVQAIITPVSPGLPFKIGEKIQEPLKMYLSDIFTIPANLAGLPGLSLNAGWVNNLPVGIQILGPQFSEELLFQIGAVYERE